MKPTQHPVRDPKPLTPRQWESVTKSMLDLVTKSDQVGRAVSRNGVKVPARRTDRRK